MDTNTRAHVASLIPVTDFASSFLPTPPPVQATSIECFPVFPPHTLPQSRRDRRKRKKKPSCDCAQPVTPTADIEFSLVRQDPPIKSRHSINHASILLPLQMKPTPSLLQGPYPLLICSIGNPGALYASTLHSAGHVVTSYLADRKRYKPFAKGLSGLVSRPDTTSYNFSIISGYSKKRETGAIPPPDQDWTLWQSTSLMNVSGVALKQAFREWKNERGLLRQEGRLVVVHDELESELGRITVRDGVASAKGHNGIKSCQQQLGGFKWWRVGVGIGRPQRRDPEVVSKYVLGKMSGSQRKALEDSTVHVFKALEDIAEGKR